MREDEGGGLVQVPLGSRALDILTLLLERRGGLVTKEEIFAAVWPKTIVDDSNLTVQIAALRRVLDQGRAAHSYIQTVSGHGYRFVAPALHEQEAVPAAVFARHLDGTDSVDSKSIASERRGGRWLSGLWHLAIAGLTVLALLVSVALLARDHRWFSKVPTQRLSIVVLPFTNLSSDPEQEYFADAVTDELTTDLSRISDSFVIARTTAFTYKNKPIDVKQIGRDLGVRYVLEGTVRRSGKEVRVSGQLIDAETGAHVWAEWFDGHTSDLFALQDEITSQIASTFSSQLIRAEASRPTENPDALDYIFRGRAAFLKPTSRGARTEQVDWFERALTIDPESVEAQANLATALSARVLDDMTDSPTADVARAERLAENALAASPHSSVAHYARGQVLRTQRRYAEAASEYEAVLASNHSWAFAMFALGQCKLYTGSIEETIPLTERAIRFSPREPQIGMWYSQIGEVYLLQSRTDEATLWLEKARNAAPAVPYIRAWLASAYALKGETIPAATELAMARKLSADARYSNLPRLRAYFDWLVPSVRTLFEATYFVGLRKAGMSDE